MAGRGQKNQDLGYLGPPGVLPESKYNDPRPVPSRDGMPGQPARTFHGQYAGELSHVESVRAGCSTSTIMNDPLVVGYPHPHWDADKRSSERDCQHPFDPHNDMWYISPGLSKASSKREPDSTPSAEANLSRRRGKQPAQAHRKRGGSSQRRGEHSTRFEVGLGHVAATAGNPRVPSTEPRQGSSVVSTVYESSPPAPQESMTAASLRSDIAPVGTPNNEEGEGSLADLQTQQLTFETGAQFTEQNRPAGPTQGGGPTYDPLYRGSPQADDQDIIDFRSSLENLDSYLVQPQHPAWPASQTFDDIDVHALAPDRSNPRFYRMASGRRDIVERRASHHREPAVNDFVREEDHFTGARITRGLPRRWQSRIIRRPRMSRQS